MRIHVAILDVWGVGVGGTRRIHAAMLDLWGGWGGGPITFLGTRSICSTYLMLRSELSQVTSGTYIMLRSEPSPVTSSTYLMLRSELSQVTSSTYLMLRSELSQVTSSTYLMLRSELSQVTSSTDLMLRSELSQVSSSTYLMLRSELSSNFYLMLRSELSQVTSSTYLILCSDQENTSQCLHWSSLFGAPKKGMQRWWNAALKLRVHFEWPAWWFYHFIIDESASKLTWWCTKPYGHLSPPDQRAACAECASRQNYRFDQPVYIHKNQRFVLSQYIPVFRSCVQPR